MGGRGGRGGRQGLFGIEYTGFKCTALTIALLPVLFLLGGEGGGVQDLGANILALLVVSSRIEYRPLPTAPPM